MHKANPPTKVRCSFTASDPVKRVAVGASTGSHESDEPMESTLVLLWCRTARSCDRFLVCRFRAVRRQLPTSAPKPTRSRAQPTGWYRRMRSPQGHRCRQSVGEPTVTMAVRPDTTSATLSYGSARLNPTFTPPFGRSQLAHPEFELGNVVWAESADSALEVAPRTGGAVRHESGSEGVREGIPAGGS